MSKSASGGSAPISTNAAPSLAALPPFLSRDQLCALTGLSYVSIWKMMTAGSFPLAVNIAPGAGKCNRWDTTEILNWWAKQRDTAPRQQLGHQTISRQDAVKKRRGRKAEG